MSTLAERVAKAMYHRIDSRIDWEEMPVEYFARTKPIVAALVSAIDYLEKIKHRCRSDERKANGSCLLYSEAAIRELEQALLLNEEDR